MIGLLLLLQRPIGLFCNPDPLTWRSVVGPGGTGLALHRAPIKQA